MVSLSLIILNTMNIENEEDKQAAKNLARDIRKSKLSGKFYWDLWQQSDPSRLCKKALNYLTSQEKVTLTENVASLRHNCQTKKEFTSVYYCCFYLERMRFSAQIFSELRKNSVTLTKQVCQKCWDQVHGKVKIRLTELGLTTFEEAMQQKEQRLNKKLVHKEQQLPQKLASKLTEPITDFKKLPQRLFEKIKAAFKRKIPSEESHLKQETEEFIEYQKSQKEKKL